MLKLKARGKLHANLHGWVLLLVLVPIGVHCLLWKYSKDYIVLIWARSSPATDMSCVINGLDPFLDYVLYVIGINSFKERAPSDLIALEDKCYIFLQYYTCIYIHNYNDMVHSHSSSLYV